jgi:hypothetical protein
MTDPNSETFTNADVNDEIASAPQGTFVALPDLTALGITDVSRAFKNYAEGSERARAALSQGFFIEVINLRVQHTEFWLRVLLVHAKGSGYVIPPNDKRTFGQVIEECASALPQLLIDRLRKFNRSRIEAVHKYLLGGTDYPALKQACDDSEGLDKEVYDMVISKVGRPITSIQGRVGELIVRKGAETEACSRRLTAAESQARYAVWS